MPMRYDNGSHLRQTRMYIRSGHSDLRKPIPPNGVHSPSPQELLTLSDWSARARIYKMSDLADVSERHDEALLVLEEMLSRLWDGSLAPPAAQHADATADTNAEWMWAAEASMGAAPSDFAEGDAEVSAGGWAGDGAAEGGHAAAEAIGAEGGEVAGEVTRRLTLGLFGEEPDQARARTSPRTRPRRALSPWLPSLPPSAPLTQQPLT